MRMKIPESVRIGGLEYEVSFTPNLRVNNNLCYGKISFDDGTIELSDTDGLGHEHQCITLWHEILHGIREHACFPMDLEEEERIVEMYSKGIYQVLQDNGRRLFDIVSDSDAS